ncbi:hypothetical protein BC827DRAFT_351769 [Russula dissimulans]|nr:hypothetical protein BC827DRAFT_351769 [Russula dissimulans]
MFWWAHISWGDLLNRLILSLPLPVFIFNFTTVDDVSRLGAHTVPEGFRSKAIATTLRAFGDKTNVLSPRLSAGKPTKADPSPPSRFASRKASATVALTSTTALRTWKPFLSIPPGSSREENVIPFPTATAGEQHSAYHTPIVHKRPRPLPVEARRRRSGALVPASAQTSATVVVRPVAKRPRKSKRVLADLQFMASVHRSIAALHAETQSRPNVNVDTHVVAMDVEDGSSCRDVVVTGAKEELSCMDQELATRLAERLRTSGLSSALMDTSASAVTEDDQRPRSYVPQEGTRAPPPSPEMEPGVYAMDVTPDPLPASQSSSCEDHIPAVPTMPPPPLPLPGHSSPPSSPPGLVSPRAQAEIPPEKRVYTMPQLVATHIMRLHERGSPRVPGFHSRASPICSPLRESVVRIPTSHFSIAFPPVSLSPIPKTFLNP